MPTYFFDYGHQGFKTTHRPMSRRLWAQPISRIIGSETRTTHVYEKLQLLLDRKQTIRRVNENLFGKDTESTSFRLAAHF